MGDNISMKTFKVILGYSPAANVYASKSRYVLADTQANAVKQALSLMKLPGLVLVLRVDVN